jgi:hypothetical protein
MATGRNCSMSGLNSAHHYLPTYNDVPNCFPTLNNFYWSPFSKWPQQYRKNSTLSDIITIWYVGRLSTHISNCDDIVQCRFFAILWWPFWKWRPVEIVQCQDSIRHIIIYPHIKLWLYTLKKDSTSGVPGCKSRGLLNDIMNENEGLIILKRIPLSEHLVTISLPRVALNTINQIKSKSIPEVWFYLGFSDADKGYY